MALALALALAGFEEDDFKNLVSLCSIETGRKIADWDRSRTASPSTHSESSGISSLILSTISSSYGTPTTLSVSSSRSETPDFESPKNSALKAENLRRALGKKRDILNLAENLSDPSWNLRIPIMPKNDTRTYMANRSVYYRLSEHALHEDYPMRVCRDCGFTEPSPYLFP